VKEEVKVEFDPIRNFQIPDINEEEDDDAIEHQTDSLMKLMQDIKNLREVNKTLTDEERRKNAEEMVMKLSQYMNIDEDEEDDDEAYK
jgi:hypothetical protein